MKAYLDNAATTQVDPRVVKEMLPYFSKKYGNASSLHSFGIEATEALEKARIQVAKLINSKPEEIYFTSGGTESDNLAIRGIMKKGHLITSSIEHPAILNTVKVLNVEKTILPVDKDGIINLTDLKRAIRKNTKLVSIMFANNEIGTIQPIKKIGEICKKKNILFHTDAVQAVGKIPINVKKMNIDLLTISSHKIYGPKGVGALYIRKGINVEPIIHGGGHERSLRSGTENIPGIVGFGKACELARKEIKKILKMRNKLIKNILKIPDTYLNGDLKERLPNNTNFRFKYIEGEALILRLDMEGIAASTGSACSSKKLVPSHVLLAIGLKPYEAHGSLRLTLGRFSKMKDVDYVIKILPKVVKNLRNISPYKGRW